MNRVTVYNIETGEIAMVDGVDAKSMCNQAVGHTQNQSKKSKMMILRKPKELKLRINNQ